MKTLIYLMVFVLTITTQAQNVIELEEAVLFAPNISKMLTQEDYQSFIVTEKFRNDFSRDPIAFQRENFNILEYINYFSDKKYDLYEVNFKSSNGRLEVQFDKNGKLLKNRQWFSNVELPGKIKHQLRNEHKGWIVVKNKYFSKGDGEMTDKIVYRIKLQNGNKTRNIRILPDLQEEVVLASKGQL